MRDKTRCLRITLTLIFALALTGIRAQQPDDDWIRPEPVDPSALTGRSDEVSIGTS